MKRWLLLLLLCLPMMGNDWQGLQWSFESQMSGGDSSGLPAPWLLVKFWDGDTTVDYSKETITPRLARASDAGYISGTGELNVASVATSGNAPIEAFAYRVVTDGGIAIEGDRQNLLIASQQWDDAAWTSTLVTLLPDFVDSPDDADSGCTPTTDCEGALLAGDAAGEYISNTSAVAAASNAFVASVWLRVAVDDDKTVQLCIEGTGGTPEQDCTAAFQPTTSYVRYEHQHEFTGAATGNATLKIIVGDFAGNAAHGFGAQLEERCDTLGSECANHAASEYIPTTAAAAATVVTDLAYDFSTNGPGNEFCVGAWVYPKMLASDLGAAETATCYVFADGNRQPSLYFAAKGADDTWDILQGVNLVDGNQKGAEEVSITGKQWNHVGACWNFTGDAYSIWVNGAQETLDNTAGSYPADDPDFINNEFTMSRLIGTNSDQSNCHLVSDFRVYDTTLSANEWALWYNSSKGRFGL